MEELKYPYEHSRLDYCNNCKTDRYHLFSGKIHEKTCLKCKIVSRKNSHGKWILFNENAQTAIDDKLKEIKKLKKEFSSL